MKRSASFIINLALLFLSQVLFAQEPVTVPTLVPPTVIPNGAPTDVDLLPSESTVARIQRDGLLRVGILYNEPPYGELTITGELAGYDADLARALAELWDVELEFVQVTRLNRIEMLQRGEVDLLLAALVHNRELDQYIELSQSYRIGHQSVLVRAEEGLTSIVNLVNRPVGMVRGTAGERALQDWMTRTGLPLQPRPYLTLDEALSALFGGEIDGVVARDTHLLRVAAPYMDAVEILAEPILAEPYAIGVIRQDVHMRNLVNRSLQALMSDSEPGRISTLEKLHNLYFPGKDFAYAALPIYANVGDAPNPAHFGIDLPFPQGYVIPRLQSDGLIRVAGLQDPATLPASLQAVANVNQSLVQQLASRWGAQVVLVSGDPISLVEAGQADLAIGISPNWDFANRVDFSQPYLLHGDLLMASADRDIRQFGDMRGRIVATFLGDSEAKENAQAWASSINVSIRYFETTEQSAARTILDDRNADALFGDSLMLLPIYRFNTGEFEFGSRWYSREYLVLATPRNDLDFLNLVNYTLQETLRDGTLSTLLAPVLPPEQPAPEIGVWPGSSAYLGWQLGR